MLLKSIIGLPKLCFHVLYGEIRLTSESLITVCAILPNLCKDHGIPQPQDVDSDGDEHNRNDGDDDDSKVILQCSEVDWHIGITTPTQTLGKFSHN